MQKVDWSGFAERYCQAVSTAESPIELSMQMALQRVLKEPDRLVAQVELETRRGVFRPDFLLSITPAFRLAIECDGKDYHDPLRDGFRDAFLLASRSVSAITRISGRTIHASSSKVAIDVLSEYPHLLKDEVTQILKQAKREKEERYELYAEACRLRERYLEREGGDSESYLIDYTSDYPATVTGLFQRFRADIKTHSPPFGALYIQFAQANPSSSIDALVCLWRNLFGEVTEDSLLERGLLDYGVYRTKQGRLDFRNLFSEMQAWKQQAAMDIGS